ncbi:galactose-1-phosphate uridylyltransferase [Eggerthellaceae bacterium 24-137]
MSGPLAWTAASPAGPLEITINLAKPEKDPRDIARAAAGGRGSTVRAEEDVRATEAGTGDGAQGAAAAPAAAEDCVLCWHRSTNGSLICAGAGGGAVRSVLLGDEEWAWWFSPYGYFPEHLIASAPVHRPMSIDHAAIARLFDFADAFPRWFIGSNADLPIVGGSLLAHDHFQGGGHRFPLMNAPVERAFKLSGLSGVHAGIVHWPASVVRLRGSRRETVREGACRVLDAWRGFSWGPGGIVPFTRNADGTVAQHSTLNPILWREGDDYVMDLVLRNNRTTPERPFGLFHVPETLFHIKKENIGLIEIMGRAILPGRLAAEMPAVKGECERAYYEILQATGVFKRNEVGRAGWDALLGAV